MCMIFGYNGEVQLFPFTHVYKTGRVIKGEVLGSQGEGKGVREEREIGNVEEVSERGRRSFHCPEHDRSNKNNSLSDK